MWRIGKADGNCLKNNKYPSCNTEWNEGSRTKDTYRFFTLFRRTKDTNIYNKPFGINSLQHTTG
ncbi:hypothetical protein M2132_000803 [Dysgonomonas sp. PH5-45]|nr:hypothetical protein [Dysgonomonas sp. PH5-45]MDH6387468.1 hypothetical protein [Dysgonomonas sp. PH5-37]